MADKNDNRINPPKDLVRIMGEPEIDESKRTIVSEFVTRKLARDGGIVIPDGIVVRFYEENPVVMARHGMDWEQNSPVIGRSLGLERTDRGMKSVTQFAETDLGSEYAYLYGLNPKREVYMRAWSFGWSTLELSYWSLEEAKDWLGSDWEEDAIGFWIKREQQVWVAKRSEMHEYSAVPVGADREALSRAFKTGGIEIAGDIVAAVDLKEARAELARVRKEIEVEELRLIRRQIQALSRDGAAAAERGDSAAILEEVRNLRKMIKGE